MTHPIWQLAVNDNGAALILTPCPGTKGTSLAQSIAELKAEGATVVVTALSLAELAEHGLSDLPAMVEQAGLSWVHAPIEDDCAPDADFQANWQQQAPLLHAAIEKGDKIVMHCMGGSGRTGLLAAHLLLEQGWPLADIISKVQALRPGAFTKQVQIDYITAFAAQ